MNVNRSGLFWGILLIGFGALALAQQMGYMDQLPDSVWIWIFALISLVAFVAYATSGWKQWGWLFPAGIFGGLAVTAALALNNVGNAAVGSPLFFGLLLPFAAAYLTDRKNNWWALIPGGVMLFLAMVTLLVDNVGGEWVGSLFLFLIGLSFFVVYLNNRTRSWALLVAYILFVLSIAPAMASFGGDVPAYFGSIFLFAVALPFFYIYYRSSGDQWWAIIPAGVLTTLAVITTFAIAGWITDANQGGFANAILMLGLAATFAAVWLRHAKPWAKIVTIVLAVLGVVSLFFASYTEIIWPLAIILVGAYLLYTALRPKMA
ncbi:MAG: hypothetical protein C3F07_07720 [Anaerolineales bacterium]|nr:MAG: hypothetical protein C3F07_07720 [Anaerolineales bacterium]